jgi:hypothetical protein
MPRKSAKQATAKKAVAKKSAAKKSAKNATAKKAAVKRTGGKERTAHKKKADRKPAAKAQRLPRPLVTAEEKLFLLFKDDYHARQIFDFLRAGTVGELEQYTPRQIVARLSKPIEDAVERIRHKLAEKNRYLSGDEAYLLRTKAS